MTAAICLKCGAMKVGAFSPCFKCGFMPESTQDQARSILLSDRNLDASALKDTARSISDGATPKFDEAEVAEMAIEIEQLLKQVPPRPIGCLVLQWGLIALAALLAGLVAYLYWYVRHGR